jgi:hypothetical protein
MIPRYAMLHRAGLFCMEFVSRSRTMPHSAGSNCIVMNQLVKLWTKKMLKSGLPTENFGHELDQTL